MQAIVKKSKVVLGRRGKCEALAMGRDYKCLQCGAPAAVVWREWYGWRVQPAVCAQCCKKLFEKIEQWG
jgi:hypothetical protein